MYCGTPTFWQRGLRDSCFQNPSESSAKTNQEKMPFKDISYLELRLPFRSAEPNHLWNYIRGYVEEQFCESILNLGQWFKRRCCLKDFLSGALAALLFGGEESLIQGLQKRASWGTSM